MEFNEFMKMMSIMHNLGGNELVGEAMGEILVAQKRRETLTPVETSKRFFVVEEDPKDLEIQPGVYFFRDKTTPSGYFNMSYSVQYDDLLMGDDLYEVLPMARNGGDQDAIRRITIDKVREIIKKVWDDIREKEEKAEVKE